MYILIVIRDLKGLLVKLLGKDIFREVSQRDQLIEVKKISYREKSKLTLATLSQLPNNGLTTI